MKVFLFILSFLFILNRAYAFSLISFDEFNKLDKQQKVEYLSGLQKILVQMAEKSPLIAETENSEQDRLPASGGPFFPEELRVASAETFSGANPVDAASRTPPSRNAPVADVPPRTSLSQGETLDEAPARPRSVRRPTVTRRDAVKSDFRCMHSGWIIEGEKCQAPEKVPESWGFEYVLREVHKCDKGSSLCNPLIFGLKLPAGCTEIDACTREAKAFCSTDSLKPTSDCYRQANANDKSGTKVAAALLTDVDKSKAFFEDYKNKMKNLCDANKLETNHFMNKRAGKQRSADSKRKAIQDVLSTCDWANKQLAELNSIVTSSGRSGQSSPDSGTPPRQGSQK